MGKGYDNNDSFIDDSDAIDVQLPKNMTLKHGGFYMNQKKIKLEKVAEKKSSSKKSRKEEVVDGKEEENNSGGEENEDNEEVGGGGGAEGEELGTEEEFDSDEYTSD